MIVVKKAKTSKDFKDFVNFPFDLYKNSKYWVPPISKEELNRYKDDVYIYSGDDALTKDFIKHGAVGVVSVASHLIGTQIKNMINLIQAGDDSKAEDVHDFLLPLISLIFEEPSPGPVKHLLTTTWEDVGKPLLPMTEVSEDLAKKLNETYSKLNI